MGLSLAARLACAPPAFQREWLAAQSLDVLRQIRQGWWWWTARPEQLHPAGDWFVWLYMAGRGAGKTRAGAEWLIDRVLKHPVDEQGQPTEWLAIAQTLTDARSVMIEGVSGLLACIRRRGLKEGKDFWYRKAPRLLIDFATGQRIYIESADDADVGRGFNAAGAWLDEICKWQYARASWMEGIMPSLRARLIGDFPRVFVSTTPKPIKLLIDWSRDRSGSVHLTAGSTFDNRANLSDQAIREMEAAYGGSSIGQQELYGRLLEDVDGALWTRKQIDADRVRRTPELVRLNVAMDPNAVGTGDETGLIAVGADDMDHHYIIGDWSGMETGHAAALKAWRMFHHFDADKLIVEKNQGQVWLATVLRDAYAELQREGLFHPGGVAPLKLVDAKAGKRLRAQPIASRHEQHLAHMCGGFVDLEDQLVTHDFSDTKRDSPDRLDAMVYAELDLQGMEQKRATVEKPMTERLEGVADAFAFSS
jgi:phage terminase large subunit-like protein